MEMKVWLDGYQRVVCGVTEQTTCQDIMIALAHASGKTGRFTLIEKWRSNERYLSPTDFPLVLLQKWGEYSSDVQLILCHSRVGTARKHRGSGLPRPASSPPEHVPVKKSLTFSGAHAGSTERPAAANGRAENCSRNICHSVESSEQGSVASQSSASLSPYMSLDRTQLAEGNLSNGDLEKDFRMRRIWSPDHLKQGFDDGTADGNRARVPSQDPVPVVSRTQVPVPSVRSSKGSIGAEIGYQMPKLGQRKEALALEPKQQNGSIVLETKRVYSSDAAPFRNPQIVSSTSSVIDSNRTSDSNRTPVSSRTSSVSSNVSSNVSWKAPTARDKNDNLVSDSGPSVSPLKRPTVKPSDLFRPPEQQNGPRKENENQPKEVSWGEKGLGRERPVAAKRNRGPVAGNYEGVVPLRTDSPSSGEAQVTSRPTEKQAPSSTPAPSFEAPVTSRFTGKQAPSSTPAPSFEAPVTSRFTGKQAPSSTPAPSFEAPVTSRFTGKQAPCSTSAPSVVAPAMSRPTGKQAPLAPSVEASVTFRPTGKQAPSSSLAPSVEAPVPPKKGHGSEVVDPLKEAKEKKELVDLIGRQEREMLKCESRLKDLNNEISALEGDLEVDERQLESQLLRIEELESTERELEDELEELELVSWEDKLVLERQKEKRIRTEIILLQSSIAKSEAEITAFVEKIRSLTIKTEEATQELNRSKEERKEKESKDIRDLESNLSRATKDSKASESALRSLEAELSTADRSLSRKKEELEELEGQLKKVNLEFFLQEPRESASTRRSRGSVLERLGLSRPGSSRRIQRYDLSPLRLNQTIDEADRPALGYIV